MSFSVFSKPRNRWLIGLTVTATLVTGAIICYGSQYGLSTSSQSTDAVPTVKRVSALGRLEPEAEVIHLSAPLALDGDRVAKLLVKEGDRVEAEQVVAILDSRDHLQDALRQAQKQVGVAKAKLAQVKAGAKAGGIQAQQATIARFQAEREGEITGQSAVIARWQSGVRNARAEYGRFQSLHQQGAIATSSLDGKRLTLETAQAQLDEAKAKQSQTARSLQAQLSEARATLSSIAEVRPVDMQTAQAEVETAIAAVKQAQTDLEEAYIRAPMAGQILKIHTRPGEKIDDAGIADMAQTSSMVAVAEVYQTDISKIRVGQEALITSQAFAGELRGTVYQVGLQVSQQNVFSNQPGENLDRRVVEVKIRLNREDSKRVAGFTNLQVQTVVHL